MASLESLPPDQRAVLQLVLQRGRSYDQIAQMLSIDRAAVRDRALAAFDSIGPQTRVAPERRALITDFLLGQLPPRVAEMTTLQLATSAPDRAWARVLASEIAPLASSPLPQIPVDGAAAAPPAEERHPEELRRVEPTPARALDDIPGPAPEPGMVDKVAAAAAGYGLRDPESPEAQLSSRRGGAILIAVGVLVAVVVVVIVIATGGSNSNNNAASNPGPGASQASTPTPSTPSTASTPTTASTATTGTKPQLVGQFNLTSPTGTKSPVGVAQVVKQGTSLGIVIVAKGVAANNHNAYAVWLSNGTPAGSKLLGFVNPAVKTDGALRTAGVLPSGASSYKQVLITAETTAKPTAPGQVLLQGALSLS